MRTVPLTGVLTLCVASQLLAAEALPEKLDPLTKYVKAFKKTYKKKAKICGLHTYSDANRFRSDGTKAMIKALGCSEYWVTESGGMYDFASFWSPSNRKKYKCKNADACQLKAMKYLFKLVKSQKKIKRLYIRSFYGSHSPRFDAGIVLGGPGQATTPRPAYKEVKKYT